MNILSALLHIQYVCTFAVPVKQLVIPDVQLFKRRGLSLLLYRGVTILEKVFATELL